MTSFQEHINKNHPGVSTGSAEYELLAGIWDAAIQAAGKACDTISSLAYSKYKGADGGPVSGRADPHDQGRSCGADECADAVRQLFPLLTAETDDSQSESISRMG